MKVQMVFNETTAADSRRQAKCEEKIALMKPDPKEFISSSLKGIQTVIENLTNRIDTILQSLQSSMLMRLQIK